jgi:hypothetical protein
MSFCKHPGCNMQHVEYTDCRFERLESNQRRVALEKPPMLPVPIEWWGSSWLKELAQQLMGDRAYHQALRREHEDCRRWLISVLKGRANDHST